MIIKLQRPLESTQANAPALAYDQRRTLQMFVPMNKAMRDLFGDKAKIYVDGEVNGKNIDIRCIVPDRGW